MLGTVFVPVTAFLHAAMGSSRTRLLRALSVVGILFSTLFCYVALTTDLLIDHAHRYFWGYYPIYGPLGPVLMAYYALFFVGGGAIYRSGQQQTRSVTQRKRMRIRLAALLLAMPATIDFLPTQDIAVYPFGYAFIMGYIMLSTFSLWRYRLVDITPALAAKQITETMSEGLLVLDRDGVVRVANDAATRLWGERKGLLGASSGELAWAPGGAVLEALEDPDADAQMEETFAGDGDPRRVIVSSSKLVDHLGAWVGTVYIFHDITDRWQAETALRASEERFRSLVQNASDLITVVAPDTTVLYQSPAIQRVLGFDADATVGARLIEVVHPDDRTRFVAALGELMNNPETTITGEGRVQDSAGMWRHLEFTGTDQRLHPAIGGLVLNVRDVTERKRLEDQLRQQALHDPLTGLGNRTRFSDRLDHALQRAERSNEIVAVLFMDLDNFKAINDSMGHSAGDALLMEVAKRLAACLRPADTIARLGGDEFAILLEGIARADEATSTADRIFGALRSPILLDGRELAVRASIGIATTEGGTALPTGEHLLQQADTAMYVAKSHGRGCARLFEPAMQAAVVERLELLADLPRALTDGQFVLQYQPILLLRTGELFGVEALVRWQHPERGLIQPNEFIPVAEDSGAIVPLGSWVLSEACRQGADWQAQFGEDRSWVLSVNVSVHQLKQPNFVPQVEETLRSSGLSPKRLILEITESVLLPHETAMLTTLRALKGLGVGLAIDDFGTGYSSIAYLKDFPFDLLKIDKSFIDDIGAPQQNAKELTKAIVELGRTLNLELVAEGIERNEQLAGLQSMDCELGQGFYFARPLSPVDVEKLFASTQHDRADAA